MQFTTKFTSISFGFLAALTFALTANGAAVDHLIARDASNGNQPATYIVSETQFKRWLATTDADLTFHGSPIVDNPLASRDMQKRDTMVTYCTKRVDTVCGGSCNVYNGGPTCIDASGTSCIAATTNVAFCDKGGCGGSCNQLSTCGTELAGGFCDTPGTKSIVVGA